MIADLTSATDLSAFTSRLAGSVFLVEEVRTASDISAPKLAFSFDDGELVLTYQPSILSPRNFDSTAREQGPTASGSAGSQSAVGSEGSTLSNSAHEMRTETASEEISPSSSQNEHRAAEREILSNVASYRGLAFNWDGQGAAAPSATQIDLAESLALILLSTRRRPSFSVDVDGRPTFVFYTPSLYLHITVDEDGTLSWYYEKDGHDDFVEARAFSGAYLPAELRDLLI